MTIYRCLVHVYSVVGCVCLCYSRWRVDYGLVNDDYQTEVSDGALESLISDIRRDLPYSGVSILHRSLRSRGVGNVFRTH